MLTFPTNDPELCRLFPRKKTSRVVFSIYAHTFEAGMLPAIFSSCAFFCRFHIHDVKWYVFCIVSFLVAPFLLLMKMRKLKIYAYVTRVYAVFVLQFLCTWCAYTILHVCVVFMAEKAILVTTRERSISSKCRSRNLPNYSVIVWTWNGWTHALKLCLFSHQIKFLWVVFFPNTEA